MVSIWESYTRYKKSALVQRQRHLVAKVFFSLLHSGLLGANWNAELLPEDHMLHLLAIIQHTIPSFLNSFVFFFFFHRWPFHFPRDAACDPSPPFYRRRNRGSEGADIAGKEVTWIWEAGSQSPKSFSWTVRLSPRCNFHTTDALFRITWSISFWVFQLLSYSLKYITQRS